MPRPLTTLRLGTRKSPLARAQSRMVAEALERLDSGLRVELVPLLTQGDRFASDQTPLGGKGLFTQELEAGLLQGTLDLAVHSLKDLPTTLPDGLTIAAHLERGDPRDVLVSEAAATLEDLSEGAVLLTSSLRRKAQILLHRPELHVEPIRGNVETRIDKWRRSGATGLILAAAGLERLGIGPEELPIHPLDAAAFLPAPGQGTLAVEVQKGGRAEELCRLLDHPPTARAARAERALVRALGGDCALPLAAWARVGKGEPITLSALLATPDGRSCARGEASGDEPEAVAQACAATLRRDGGDVLLERLGS